MSTVASAPQRRRPIGGPTALGTDPKRLFRLTTTLALTDFKLRFFGSALGYLWQLMRPLLLFSVLYLVFNTFLELGETAKYFPVSMLLGIVLYTFLNESTSQAVRSLVLRESLVRKIEFPRIAIPAATVLTSLFNLGLNLVAVFVFLLAAGGTPRWSWLQLPLLLALLALFCLGLAALLSVSFVRYRDVEPIWDVLLQMTFYATPIFYTVQDVANQTSDRVAQTLMLTPFAAILQQAKHAVIDPSHQSTLQAIDNDWLVLVPIAIFLLVVVGGFYAFVRRAPRIAEEL